MVPILVNDGMLHRITVFEGNAEIRSMVPDWMQVRQITTRVSRRNTKKKVEASFSSTNALDLEKSNDTTLELAEGNSISLEQNFNLEDLLPTRKEDTCTQIGSTLVVNDNNSKSIQIDVRHHTRHEDDILLGWDGNMSIACKNHADTMATNNVDHGINSTQLESSIQAEAQRMQSISDLAYENDGDLYIDRLNHFWIQKNLHGHIDVIERDQWGTFDGKYFKRIENANFF